MPAVLDGAARASVRTIAERARKYRDRGLGEQNSKASLIEPLLEALGWDIRDPDEVHREFRPTSKDSPVDYALKLLRKPRLLRPVMLKTLLAGPPRNSATGPPAPPVTTVAHPAPQ